MSHNKGTGLGSLIYVHNPFYLVSTCLFVYGLQLLFRSGDAKVLFDQGAVGYMEPWGLMASLAAVTTLMCVTAVLIVRFGKVWEDARSLVLIVLLMVLAISVSFDELINVLSDRDNDRGHLFLMFGLGTGFAVTMTELLLLGLKVKLGPGYRLPLHGFLLLLFLWPSLLLTELTSLSGAQTQCLIVLFPVVAAVIGLSLIPAIRKGSASVQDNGTPWKWPLFPWTPFVFIALAVCFRSYSLTMSFDPIVSTYYWGTIFGVYQLIPIFLAVFVILLEIGIVENRPRLQTTVIVAAPILLLIANPWLVPWSHLPTYQGFTSRLIQQVASPVFITIVGLAVFYSWAWWRKVRFAEIGLSMIVALSTVFGPRAFSSPNWQVQTSDIQYWPVLLLGVALIIAGFKRRQSVLAFCGFAFGIGASCLLANALPHMRPWIPLIAIHAVMLVPIVLGVAFDDLFSRIVKQTGPFLMLVTAVAGCGLLYRMPQTPTVLISYALSMLILPLAIARLLSDSNYLLLFKAECGIAGTCGAAYGTYAFFTASLIAGVKQIVLAAVSFVAAVFISILKSGLSRRIRLNRLLKRR